MEEEARGRQREREREKGCVQKKRQSEDGGYLGSAERSEEA